VHDAPRHTRVVIVTAEVGEGHAAAARALAAGLAAESPDAEVVICDALDGLGRFLRLILLDAYRWQLRVAPWVFGILYAVSRRFAPARRLGAAVLAALGARPLLRLVARHQPTVVVSTYPAATIVLGQLRRRGRLSVPVYATITDLAGVAFWAHRGIDLHLVMHESCIAGVERVAGRDSARRVRPLVAPEFFEPRSRREARGALALPQDGTIIVVSGGGWAVGDLRGAVRAALAIGGATVLALAGREAAVRRRLEREFADELRVRVLGFTDRMSDLLSAADALVHSTGGSPASRRSSAAVRRSPTEHPPATRR
jgi:UDP-N-acetylglucosamine:LPS N-acetylglucosamine transferase